MKQKFETVRGPLSLCFDLDGTLVDTAPDLIRVLNIVIKDDGLSPVNYDHARRHISYGARALITDAYKTQGRVVSDDRVSALQTRFLELYADGIADRSQPFPYVRSVLDGLARRGHDLSVCTNKPGYLARPLLAELGMTDMFSAIVGSEDVPNKKPDPNHIFAAVGHNDPRRIVMIGDGAPDTLAAKAANVPSVVMRYGYSTTPFYRLGGTIMLRCFSQLPSALIGLTR